MKIPLLGSVANACTEVNTPERTRNVPSRLSEKAAIASRTVQLLKPPRFSVTARECINAVPTSQGMNDAFCTGSHTHHPPHPGPQEPDQLPSACPKKRNTRATVARGSVRKCVVHALARRYG